MKKEILYTLLILGGLDEFVPLVQMAQKRGIRTIVVDGYPEALAKKIADASYTVDIRNTEKIAEIARREHVQAITTAYSDILLECMVKIADAAHLPCHLKPSQLPWYRDKSVTMRTCERLGIPIPKSMVITENFSDEQLDGMTFPMVIKPLDLYGSRGLTVVHSTDEIRRYFHKALSISSRHELLAEEYDADFEFNIQCWVRHGHVQVLGLCDREKTPFDPETVPLSTRNIYPSRLISEVFDGAVNILEKYIGFTKQTEGPLAMQFFWGAENGIKVGEIAARFLGYEHELIEYADGLSIEDLLLSAAFDDDRVDDLLNACNPFGNRSAAVLYLHARDGVLADQHTVVDAARNQSTIWYNDLKKSQLFYHEGERIGQPQSMPYFARFDLAASTREQIDKETRLLLDSLTATDRNGRELLRKGTIPDYPFFKTLHTDKEQTDD